MINDNINKKGEIILCKGIKLDKNYENVLSYSESDMVSLCDANKIYRGSNYSFMETGKTLNVEVPYADAMYANYIAFKNPRFGNKWIFGFVNNVELINPKVTAITWEMDVWSTWYPSFNIGKAFIEREHVSDDTFGKHTLPEGLETGEYTIKSETDASELQEVCPVVAATVAPNASSGEYVFSSYMGNRYESLGYFIFNATGFSSYDPENQYNVIDAYIKKINNEFSDDSIVSIFMAPRKMVGWDGTASWTNFGTGVYTFRWANDVFLHENPISYDYNIPYTFTDLEVTRPTTLGSYTPVNKKCYVYPYQYINLTNNNGGNAIYNYEEFSSNKPHFEITGILAPSCSIRAVPKNYKGQTKSYNDGLTGAKYPICSWNNDLFTNWMTQQGVNIALEYAKDVMTIGAGIASGLATGGIGTALGAGLASGGISGILSTMAKVREHSLVPAQARGNTNGGDVGAANSKLTFTAQLIQVKEEYIKCVDSYFSRFGYKVSEVKTPNLNSRTQFNFIKVGGMDELVHGDIPASDLEKINDIFRKGVTIFHNYTNFGNYTISNPIVTP